MNALDILAITPLFFAIGCHQAPVASAHSVKPSGQQICSLDCSTQDPQAVTTYRIEVVPPAAQGLVMQRFDNVTSADLKAGLQIRSSAIFNGRLNDNFVLATDIIAIPQTPATQTAVAQPLAIGANIVDALLDGDEQGTFKLELLANQPYRLAVNPDGHEGLPPSFFSLTIDEMGQSEEISLNLGGPVVSGHLEFEAPYTVKIMQGDRLVSSVSEVGPNGIFSAHVAKPLYDDEKEPKLKLVLTPKEEFEYLPQINQSFRANMDRSKIDLGEIESVDPSKAARVTFSIVGQDQIPLDKAIVIARANIGVGRVNIQVLASEGMAELHLIPAEYDILVIPPKNSHSAVAIQKNIQIQSGDSPIEIRLGERSAASGSVLDEVGNPIAQAQLDLTLKSLGELSPEIRAQTNDLGQICEKTANLTQECKPLYLDPGRYRISLTPPLGSQFAKTEFDFEFSEGSPLSFQLAKATVLEGTILKAADQKPLSKAFVRIFSAPLPVSRDEQRLLGEAFTDENGHFSGLIAPSF